MESKNLGLIFDMDGVLVDSENAMRISSVEALERYGIKPSTDEFLEFTGMGEDRFIGGVAEKHGLKYKTEMKDYAYFLYSKKAHDLVFVYPKVKETLEALKLSGYKIAVASAADLVKVEVNLGCIGVKTDFFDALVTGSEVKNKKPDPEIFIAASRKLGIEPHRCMVTEDSPSGIKAAKRAGMACAAVTTSFDRHTLRKAEADYITDGFDKITDIILKWSSLYNISL